MEIILCIFNFVFLYLYFFNILNFSRAKSIPTLYNAIVETSQKIPNPIKSERDLGRNTVYDTW